MAENESEKVSPETVAALCAAEAVKMTEGIYAPPISGITDAINKNILRKSADMAGIRVNIDNDKISLDIHVEVEYGVKIPSVAWQLQENVKKQIEKETGSKVESVNVHVQRIHFEEE